MVSLIVDGELLTGRFVSRPNRFTAIVSIEGREVRCYLPDPGRMLELLIPGVKVILKAATGQLRKTNHDLIAVHSGDVVVSVDSRIPNRLILTTLKARALAEFTQYTTIKPEYAYNHSRIDFLLSNSADKCLLEVKSCTLAKGGVALFPDAPTSRGRRHLIDLMKAKKEGYRTCVLFLIQRTDTYVFSPNDETDPEFGETLRKASTESVEVYAYSSEFKGKEISLREKISIKL